MSINIRLPNITGKTTEEQLKQIQSYLIQTAGELNWALSQVSGEGGTYTPYRSVNTGGSVVDAQAEAEAILKEFSQLKGLIVKSADIVNAYYEEINKRLVGYYVAQSEYGTFVEKTTADIAANSYGITQTYKDIQIVAEDVTNTREALSGDISDTKEELDKKITDTEKGLLDQIDTAVAIVAEVNAYIRTGHLDEDEYGLPVYGLEVGQSNEVNGVEIFNRYARFTANRLSFFDQNGIEVAYISDRKLYITDVHITGSLLHGGFQDIALADGGIVTKWIW